MTQTPPDITPDADFGPVHPALAAFPARWRDTVGPQLRGMEQRRVGAVRFIAIVMGAAAAVVAGFLVWRANDGIGGFEAFAAFAMLILASMIAWAPYAKLSKEVKAIMMEPAAEAAGLSYAEKNFEPDRFDEARALKLLPGYDRKNFEDRLEGAPGGRRFVLYEAHLEQERKSKNSTTWVTVFRGIIGVLDYPSSALGTTVLARDAGWFDRLNAPRGMDRAGLVDQRFEKIFTAWTTDQVEARYFLTPVVMEALLALEARFDGKKIRGAFLPGTMMFALETGNWFEAGSLFKPLADPSRPRRLLDELGGVLHLIDTLRECAPQKLA